MAAGNKQRRHRYIRYSWQGWTKFAFDSCIKCPPLDQRTRIWTRIWIPVHWEETSLLFCWSLCLPQAKSWTESILKFREIWKKFIFLNYWTRTSQSYCYVIEPKPSKSGWVQDGQWKAGISLIGITDSGSYPPHPPLAETLHWFTGELNKFSLMSFLSCSQEGAIWYKVVKQK